MPSLVPLASLAQIQQTPSAEHGIPSELEEDLRAYGCRLINQAGKLLKQKQVGLATAQILFQRFWFVSSMKQFGVGEMAMGALFLASKLEECPLRVRNIINVYDVIQKRKSHILEHETSKFVYKEMSYFSNTFYDLRDAIVVSEMQLLKRLGFNAFVVLPYGGLINYMKVLGLVDHEKAVEKAWGYLNDALQTPIYVLYSIPTIICMAIHLTTRFLSLPMLASPVPWFTLFDANEEDIHSASGYVMRLYRVRSQEDRDRAMRLVMGGKQEVRAWLEKQDRPV